MIIIKFRVFGQAFKAAPDTSLPWVLCFPSADGLGLLGHGSGCQGRWQQLTPPAAVALHPEGTSLPPCLSCSELSVKQQHIRPSMSCQKHAKGRTLLCQLDFFFCSELSVKHQQRTSMPSQKHATDGTLLCCLAFLALSFLSHNGTSMSCQKQAKDGPPVCCLYPKGKGLCG